MRPATGAEMTMRLTFVQGSSLLVLTLLVACGGSDLKDNALEPKGGTLLLPGGVRLTVPPGALEDNQAFDFEALDAPGDQGFVAVGPFVALGPNDVTFLKPVTLTFPFGDAVGGVLAVAWSTGGTAFERVEGVVDPVARSLTIERTSLGSGGAARWPGDTLCCAVDGRARAIGDAECTARAGVILAEAACACGAEADCDDGDPCTTESCAADATCAYVTVRQQVCGDGCRLSGEACEVSDDCPGDPGVKCVDCVCVEPECRTAADCDQPDTNCSAAICTDQGVCAYDVAGCQSDADCVEGETCDDTCSCIPGG